jgi:guanylate kinase
MSSEAVNASRRGLLFIVSAPSGTGKTTLVKQLVATTPGVKISRSYTSRQARAGEQDGIDYHFVGREQFEAMCAGDGLLEWAEVFGNLYGTGAVETERVLSTGCDLVLVIDVQGARKVRRHGVRATSIFVMPPSFEDLVRRLRGRSGDSEAQIRRRLETAREEVTAYPEYDYVVVNEDLDRAVGELRAIVLAERARLDAVRTEAERIAGTFRARLNR